MIFRHTWEWVLATSPHTGKPKVQTSRVKGGKIEYVEGKVLAVQPGRGQKAVGHIRLLSVREVEYACVISQAEAEAEGCSTPEQFCELWARMHGKAALYQPRIALTFELLEGTPPRPSRLDGKHLWVGQTEEGFLFECRHCGASLLQRTPCEIDLYLAASKAFGRQHQRCQPAAKGGE